MADASAQINAAGKWGAVAIVVAGISALIAIGALPKLSDIKTKDEAAREHKAIGEDHDADIRETQQSLRDTLDLMQRQEMRWEASQQEAKAKLEKLESRSYQILQEVRRR